MKKKVLGVSRLSPPIKKAVKNGGFHHSSAVCMRLDRLLLGRGNDGPFLADSSRPDTPLLMVRLTLNPAHRNGGLTRQHQNNGSFPPVSAACRQTLKNECCERSCSNSCGPISIETDRINLQQRLLSPIFGSIQVPLPHAAVAAAPAAGGGLWRGCPQ